MTKSGKSPTRHGLQRVTHGSACGRVGLPLVVRFAASREAKKGAECLNRKHVDLRAGGGSRGERRPERVARAWCREPRSGRPVCRVWMSTRDDDRTNNFGAGRFWRVNRTKRDEFVPAGIPRFSQWSRVTSRALRLPLSGRLCARDLGETGPGTKAKSLATRTKVGNRRRPNLRALLSLGRVGASLPSPLGLSLIHISEPTRPY